MDDYLTEIEKNLSLNPKGEERERERNTVYSSERSEQQAEGGIASLGATLPPLPLEDVKRKPEPQPCPVSPEPDSPLTTFTIALNRLKKHDPIDMKYLWRHCRLDKVRCTDGHAEIPLLSIVVSEDDGNLPIPISPLIKAMQRAMAEERAMGVLDDCLCKLEEKLLQITGKPWSVTFVEEPAHG